MNKWIIVIIIAIVLIVISMYVQVPETNNITNINTPNATAEDVCKNTCNVIKSMGFHNYEYKICYCQNVLSKEIEAIYKDD